jgi:Holliday junction resolvase-like predicted endonuclease
MEMQSTTETQNLDFNKVWLMFQETKEQLQSTKDILDKKFQETRLLLDSKFQETDRQFKETDRQFKEMIAEQKRMDKKSRALEHLFTSKWGEIIETLVEGKLVDILNKRGIPVNQTTRRYEVKYNNKDYEFDIIAINGTDAVIVEVKTTLSVKYVKDFIEKMKMIKEILPIYRPFNIFGAMAFLNHHEQAEIYAQGKGLLTIRATGESAFITNPEDFKPKSW